MSYSGPTYGSSGFPIFSGSRRQVGGGVLGSIARLVTPVLKRVGVPLLKRVGKNLLDVGTNVAADALGGRNIRDSFQQHGRAAAYNALQSINPNIGPYASDPYYASAPYPSTSYASTSYAPRRYRSAPRMQRRRGVYSNRGVSRRQFGSGRITKQKRRKRRKRLSASTVQHSKKRRQGTKRSKTTKTRKRGKKSSGSKSKKRHISYF